MKISCSLISCVKSYRWFLDEGLQEVFADVASITNYAGNLELSFIGYLRGVLPYILFLAFFALHAFPFPPVCLRRGMYWCGAAPVPP